MKSIGHSLRYIFSPQYRESVFYFWYKNQQLGPKRFNVLLPVDENGFKPDYDTVKRWVEEYKWMERAEALDVEITQRMDNTIIDERIKMFQEHAKIGAEVKDFGLTYLREKGISGDMAALRAVADGVQLERSSKGLAENLIRLSQMDDVSLLKEINKMLELQQNTIDAEVEDVTNSYEDSE